jgi:hypothetical protein
MDWMPPAIIAPVAFFGIVVVIAVQALASAHS